LPEQRFCFIDSDNVFVRPFDMRKYAGGEQTPLYLDRAAIVADSPLHANWCATVIACWGNLKQLFSRPMISSAT